MIFSRRGFLGSIAALTANAAAGQPRGLEYPPTDIPGSGSSATDAALIRLDRNEGAYGPSDKVMAVLHSSLLRVNRYPPDNYAPLIDKLGQMHQVKPEQVLVGCGSTDMLRMAARAFLGPGKQLVQASATFEALGEYARASGSSVESVPLTPRFAHDLDAMLARVTPSTTLIYICNPLNPTATLTPRKDLESFLQRLPTSTFVVIDEAYHHYGGQSGMYLSFLDHPVDNDRVIVTRTFSNIYGLAGLRLGYAVASPGTAEKMRRFAMEYSVNTAAAQAAVAALDEVDRVSELVLRNANDRQEFFNQAMARAMKPIDSHANFAMMNTYHPAQDVIQHFRKNGVLIGRSFPAMPTHIRVTLGRPEEMQRFWQVWDMLPYPKHSMQH